ncbi:MAG: hypothetical protein SFV51_16550 [Bryobacteraceae bacterium]|nr:hypothetical protein [Bryobacteraceae bacterium]
MRLKLLAASSTALAIFWFAANRPATNASPITRPQPAPGAAELQAVTLIFGSKDMNPAKWDGEARISAGKIEKIEGYHFNETARILDGNRWECATYQWGQFSGGMHPNEKPQPQPTPNENIGVTIYFRAPAEARLTVKVPRGEFTFRPMDIPETEGIFPLQAMVEVYRTPVVEQLTTGEYEDDYPSLAAAGNRLYLSWVAYKDKADRVLLQSSENGQWGSPITISDRPGDIFSTAVAVTQGKPMVIWSERESTGFQLKARIAGSQTETLTSGEGNNIFHRATSDSKGNVHVVWQAFRRGRSNIFLRSYAVGKWGAEINLSDPARHARANDWEPAVVADRNGTVWVAWDTYTSGSYNIVMRPVRSGVAGELLRVTNSTRFHGHANLAVDASNRVWVAWDEAPENWGKDTGFLLSGGTGLYDSRSIKIAVYAGNQWLTPLQMPEAVAPYGFRRFTQQARMVSDSAGRMWLFFRPRSNTRLPTTLWAAGGKWEVFATYYSGSRWSDLFLLPGTVGRNGGEVSVAADAGGNVHAAMVTDHRKWGGPAFSMPSENNDIVFLKLRGEGAATADLGPRPAEMPAGRPHEPREREQVAALRAHPVQAGGKTYHIYRGDMHRHTEMSQDGAGDGTLFDAYRYAIDAAGMDYLAVTDHQSGQPNKKLSDYPWWRIQKSADLFHTPGYFTGLFGTERSLSYPNGHRNLIFAARGVPVFHISEEERKSSTGPVLYPLLRKYNGIATSHTSHTNMGTDWRDNDPDLEPIVEIFQGARTSAEHEGAPLSPTESRTELHAGGYRPLGFVANAWAKGYKLGVQASSDHVSTHTSYAMVIAENGSREALLDGMRRRHTYGATTNILLDYRATADGKTYLQGDAFQAASAPELSARITGTGPIREVVVVRDNKVIYSQSPKAERYDLRYREAEQLSGEHFYYVRVEQENGHVAWSSPVWIKR